jgi:hypothetical protein
MTIPANALIYGTFLNISPVSFAIINTVLTVFVVVDSGEYIESTTTKEGAAGTTGIPWATVVINEACNPTV